jgi:ABC-type multidrug transport system ATPase subunit
VTSYLQDEHADALLLSDQLRPAFPDDPVSRRGVHVDIDGLSRSVGDRKGRTITLLDDVSFSIAAGELVAIIGPSGAGKTTALESIAGIAPITSGSVRLDGTDLHANLRKWRGLIGYVPQSDIIHTDLPLEHTLRYAARLRLPSSTSSAAVDEAVQAAMATVGLSEHADVRVGSLSGGQRKRASIAVELLSDPQLFFLDEPTSGLDPSTAADITAHLRKLAGGAATVVFTTHSVEDLAQCDRIVFMAKGGRVAFVGTLADAMEHFNVASVAELYRQLAEPPAGTRSVKPSTRISADDNSNDYNNTAVEVGGRPVAGPVRQWSVLTRRTFETLVRNPLTLAILLASPVLVVGMFAVLFRPGAFDVNDPSPSSMVMIGFWVVFAAFFFGITYGLLQICTEQTILHRERLVGLRLGPYVASKVTVLVPFLLAVIVAMLGVLRLLDRLPSRPLTTYASIGLSLLLCAVAALGLGLLASASVGNVAQATLALPMLCFPAVLFSGAILPVHLMATAGVFLSAVIPSRWAFEAMGHDLGARHILAHGHSPLGQPLLASYGDAGTWSTATYCLLLGVFAVVFLIGTWCVLRRTTRWAAR